MGDVSLKVIRVWRQTHYHKWKKKQHEMSSRKSRPTKAKGVAVPEEKSSANFLFVEVAPSGKSLADKELRTSIQKHVMRDIGRARKTKNCYGHSKLDVRILSTSHKHDDSKSEQRHFMLSRGISGTGRMDPFTNYPIEMTLEILFLLDHVYTCTHSYLIPFRDSWLSLSLSDPGSFQEVLSKVALHVADLVPEGGYCKQAAKLHAAAVRSVQNRLSDPVEGISEGVVQSIMAFACFSHATGDWKTYETHMAGLQTIIGLRGGIKSMDKNRALRLLLAGIDIASVNFHGGLTHFSHYETSLNSFESSSSEQPWALPEDGISALWERCFTNDAILSCIFSDLCTFNMTVKHKLAMSHHSLSSFWHSTTFVPQYVNPLTYRLIASTVEIALINPENHMNESCRIAALLFLEKIRRKFVQGPQPHQVPINSEVAKLRNILHVYYSQWGNLQPLLLWVCVMGALSSEIEEETLWWLQLVARTVLKMGCPAVGWSTETEWIKAVTLLRGNLLWIGAVMDGELETLGREVSVLLPYVAVIDDLEVFEDLQL